MKTRIFTRALARVGSVCDVVPQQIRVVAVAAVMLLLLVAMFYVHHTEGAANLTQPQAGEPVNLIVTATTNTSISLSWIAPAGGAAQYRVERSQNMSGPFVLVANAFGTSFTDTTVTSLRAYLYRVIAVTSDGCPSGPSNEALGTAISFEFSQLLSQPIKARHLHDVRTAINAVRAVANLSPATWTPATLLGLEIKATDVQELRNRLTEALTALGMPIDAYQDPVFNTGPNGTLVKAIHLEQLQTRSTRGVRTPPIPQPEISTDVRQVGKFDTPIPLPLVPVHLSVLPDGRILFWGRDMDVGSNGDALEVGGRSEAYVWNMDDGSNKTDLAVFRSSEQNWYIVNSSTGTTRVSQWGIASDLPVPGDYDGDGRGDLAIYRPSDNLWGIKNSSNGIVTAVGFGVPTDVRVQADYDRDGKTDIAVFRPSEGKWFIRESSTQSVKETPWGQAGDIPVPGDYDRDRKIDIAVFRPSEGRWHIRKSSNPSGPALIKNWGQNGDVTAPGDYNGDGTTDLAVYRPADGNFYVKNIIAIPEKTQVISVAQSPSAVVAPGDYDGDGKTDAAIFRSSDGAWQIRNSSNGILQLRSWGQNGDIPVATDYDGMLRVANSTTNMFCSGHSFLPDGRLFVAGGHKRPEFDRAGEPHTNIFDYRTNCWTRGPDMNQGRWYPYNVTLSTGETLILSGTFWSNTSTTAPTFAPNLDAEVYTGGPTLRNLAKPQSITFYPYLHLTPEGKVLQVQSGFVDPTDLNTLSKEGRLFDPATNAGFGRWYNLDSTRFPHAMGTAVLFDSGKKVLVMGGFDSGLTPTTGAEFIDLSTTSKTWKTAASMNFPRAYHTATILPDGKVLVTGGVQCTGSLSVICGKVLNAEMWDPSVNPTCPSLVPWRTMAAQSEVRAYHSIAALLPNGKVLVGGGGLPGARGEEDLNETFIASSGEDHARLFGHKSVEIYTPPYLFDANGNEIIQGRPQITSVAPTISYGQSFLVGTSGAGSAPKFSLVRLASVTHGFNQDQRQIFLNSSVIDSSTINVTAPADSKICPPGYYMMFLLNNGVPSIAKIVRVQHGQTHSLFPTDVPQATASAQGSTWEQGVEFSSSVSGQITHIRFWKSPSEQAGNHVGRIWDATGTLIAATAFPCESPSGWQEVQLQTPVQITADVKYRVTFNLRNEGVKTFNTLDSPLTRGPLTAWRSVFSTPEGSFPTTVSGSNLFVDFVFKTGQ